MQYSDRAANRSIIDYLLITTYFVFKRSQILNHLYNALLNGWPPSLCLSLIMREAAVQNEKEVREMV